MGTMDSITDDWDEVELPAPNKVKPARRERMPAWREAERYFKRYRDTKKVIPLRMKLKDGEVG